MRLIGKRVYLLSIVLALTGCSRPPEQTIKVTFYSNTPLYRTLEPSQQAFDEKLKPFILPLTGGPDCDNVTFEPQIYLRRFDQNQSKTVLLGSLEKLTQSTGIDAFLSVKLSGKELEEKVGKTIRDWKPPVEALAPSATTSIDLSALKGLIVPEKPNVLVYLTDEVQFSRDFSKLIESDLKDTAIVVGTTNSQKTSTDLLKALCKLPASQDKPLEIAYIVLSEQSQSPARPVPPPCPRGQVGTPPNCSLPVPVPVPVPPPCPRGQVGTPPNCSVGSKPTPDSGIKDCQPGTPGCDGFTKGNI